MNGTGMPLNVPLALRPSSMEMLKNQPTHLQSVHNKTPVCMDTGGIDTDTLDRLNGMDTMMAAVSQMNMLSPVYGLQSVMMQYSNVMPPQMLPMPMLPGHSLPALCPDDRLSPFSLPLPIRRSSLASSSPRRRSVTSSPRSSLDSPRQKEVPQKPPPQQLRAVETAAPRPDKAALETTYKPDKLSDISDASGDEAEAKVAVAGVPRVATVPQLSVAKESQESAPRAVKEEAKPPTPKKQDSPPKAGGNASPKMRRCDEIKVGSYAKFFPLMRVFQDQRSPLDNRWKKSIKRRFMERYAQENTDFVLESRSQSKHLR